MPQKPKIDDPYAAIAEDPYAAIAEGSAPKGTTGAAPPSGPAFDVEQERKRYKESNPLQRGISSFDTGWGVPQNVQEHPSLAATGIKLAVMHPSLEAESLRQMWNGMSQDQQELIDRAYTLQHAPGLANKANGFVLGIYSAIPVFGPAIVHALDQWKSGDKAGAVGSLAAVGSQLYRPGEARVAEPGTGGEMARLGVVKPSLSERVADRAQSTARHLTEATHATKDAVTKAIEKQTADLAKNRAERESTIRGNVEKQHAAETEIDRKKLQIAQENKAIEAANQTQADTVAQRARLAKEVDQNSVELGKDLESLENAVYQEANRKFDAIRQKIGNPQAPPDALIASVKDAEQNILQGVPENVKEFRRILGMEGTTEELTKLRQDVMAGQGMTGMRYEDLSPERKALIDNLTERWGGQITTSEPLTWDKLQSLKSRLDLRLRNNRGMNGDLKRALFAVRGGVVDEMGQMAQSQGVTSDWDAARSFYRQWREDFHEPRGPSGSGSPVAQALDAVDPSKIRQPFGRSQSTIGNRGIDILRRYSQFGGDKAADRVQSLLSKQEQMESLPEKVKPQPLKKAPEATQMPTRKPAPAIPGKPAVDVQAESLQAVENAARRIGRLNAWDARIVASSVVAIPVSLFLKSHLGLGLEEIGLGYVVTKYLLSRSLERPEIANWIAHTPKAELDALNNLPGREKIIVKAGIAELTRHISDGKHLPVSRDLRGFLGPENIKRLAEAGVVTAGREKLPGEQLRDLRQIQERYSSNPNFPTGQTEP